MKLIIAFTSSLILMIGTAKAQDYFHSVGYRGGVSQGFSYKSFANEERALDFLLTLRHKGIQFTWLYEIHQPAYIFNSDKFQWYAGFGSHLGYHKAFQCVDCFEQDTTNNTVVYEPNIRKTNFIAFGADVVFGLEYNFMFLPLTISAEYKPYIGFFGPARVSRSFVDFAGTIRYVFR